MRVTVAQVEQSGLFANFQLLLDGLGNDLLEGGRQFGVLNEHGGKQQRLTRATMSRGQGGAMQCHAHRHRLVRNVPGKLIAKLVAILIQIDADGHEPLGFVIGRGGQAVRISDRTRQNVTTNERQKDSNKTETAFLAMFDSSTLTESRLPRGFDTGPPVAEPKAAVAGWARGKTVSRGWIGVPAPWLAPSFRELVGADTLAGRSSQSRQPPPQAAA